jgi:hypothetical protein
MIRGKQFSKVGARAAGASPPGQLPYAVELWNLTRTGPERVIARAASVSLARAIFAAACTEHLGRRLVLRRGQQVLMQSE